MVSKSKKFAARWGRAGIGWRVLVILLGFLCGWMLLEFEIPDVQSDGISSYIFMFGVTNLEIAVLLVLGFVIGRHLVKLVFDKRRGLLGSSLQLKLVTAFIGIAVLPTVLLFVSASDMLSDAMGGWFNTQIRDIVNASIKVGQQYSSVIKEITVNVGRDLAQEIEQKPLVFEQQQLLKSHLGKAREKWELFSITIYNREGELIIGSFTPLAGSGLFTEPENDRAAFRNALLEKKSAIFEKKDSGKYVRAYIPLQYNGSKSVLRVSLRIKPKLVGALEGLNASASEYHQFKHFKGPIKSSYILYLALLACAILFAAVWLGMYIAKRISVPIQKLADGTRSIARGNHDFTLKVTGDDEMALLVESFNSMNHDIKHGRDEIEKRRIFIETILNNLAVSVIAIDSEDKITMINYAASELLSSEGVELEGKPIVEILPEDLLQKISELSEEDVEKEEGDDRERTVTFHSRGRERKLVCTVGNIPEARGGSERVLLFDDITDLAKAQQMSAWREVARRIAHEIKNPLTPIQLSAQRLGRLLSKESSTGAVQESIQAIVENVASIKRLANEFSNLARMPVVELKKSSLNFLLSETISPFAENHPDIVFKFIADNHLPDLMLDREQIRRVAINLIDNAISSIKVKKESEFTENPRITTKTYISRSKKWVCFEVSDNGPGVSDADKNRIFEPYFTTREKGTGLGLAIVTSIVSDHHGDLKVYDNKPCGAKFVIRLPYEQGAEASERKGGWRKRH